jgi:hypothetical protein
MKISTTLHQLQGTLLIVLADNACGNFKKIKKNRPNAQCVQAQVFHDCVPVMNHDSS